MRRQRIQHGSAAVELAILLIPMVVMVFGMTELGRAVYYYNGLVSSTRDAARYLSTVAPGAGEPQAACLAVYGNPQCEGDAVVPGLTTGMVRVDRYAGVDTGHGPINLVSVSITGYPFESAVPYVIPDLRYAAISCTMRQAS